MHQSIPVHVSMTTQVPPACLSTQSCCVLSPHARSTLTLLVRQTQPDPHRHHLHVGIFLDSAIQLHPALVTWSLWILPSFIKILPACFKSESVCGQEAGSQLPLPQAVGWTSQMPSPNEFLQVQWLEVDQEVRKEGTIPTARGTGFRQVMCILNKHLTKNIRSISQSLLRIPYRR